MGREEDVPGEGNVGASLFGNVFLKVGGGPTGVHFIFLHVYV